MGGLKEKVGKILDPANIFGKRSGGFSMADAIDPGGSIIKTTTGSDIGRKIADPANLYPENAVTPAQRARGATAAEIKTEKAKKDKLARYRNLRAKRKTIMNTELENFK